MSEGTFDSPDCTAVELSTVFIMRSRGLCKSMWLMRVVQGKTVSQYSAEHILYKQARDESKIMLVL